MPRLNAWTSSDRHVKLARDRGMKVIISTDAHDPQHFKLMRYGVTTARRGWMEKSGVLNTLPPEKLLASLRPLPGVAPSLEERYVPGSSPALHPHITTIR